MKCCDKELEFKVIGGIDPKIMRATCAVCGINYDKKQYSDVIYRYRPETDDFVCNKCGEEIMTSEVAHTMRDGLFPFSGSGRVRREPVPYCPNCEKKPDFRGKPVMEKDA